MAQQFIVGLIVLAAALYVLWRYPLLMVAYLFGLAYAASFVTYRIALALGGGA